MSAIQEMLHSERNRLISQAREIQARASNEEGLSAEDQTQFDQVTQRAAELNDQMETYQKLERDARAGDKSAELKQDLLGMASHNEVAVAPQPETPTLREMGLAALRGEPTPHMDLRTHVVRDWLASVDAGLTAKEYVQRAVGSDSGTTAGLAGITIPTMVESRFYEVLRNIHGLRLAGADVWTTMGGEPQVLPKATDTTPAPPTSILITNEAGEISDADPSFSGVTTKPVKFAGRTYVSREILEDSTTDIEARVVLNLARRIGWLTEYAYHNGSGTDQPQGILANVPAGNTTTNATKGTLTWKEILSVKYQIGNFPMGAQCWSMSKATWGAILGLTGTDGHPILLPASMPGYSDMLFGSPVKFNEFTGAVDTANAILALYGDFYGAYIIRDVGTVRIDMDMSHRFIYDQSTYRAILRTDGRFINDHLVAALKEKAS